MQQSFTKGSHTILRRVEIAGKIQETEIANLADDDLALEAAWWQSHLKGARVTKNLTGNKIRIVDAFCGSGGLGLGVQLAAEAAGRQAEFAAIIDSDETALSIHSHNLGGALAISASAASLVDFHVLGVGSDAAFGYAPEIVHPQLENVGTADVFIAGPPCQGHSNLNNHTRRQDPRNDLYVTAVAIGVALQAQIIIIENVPTVLNSHSEVVATAESLLRSEGYGISSAVLRADELGAAQTRRRHFLVAVKNREMGVEYLSDYSQVHAAPPMPVSWAIGDLVDSVTGELMNSYPALTPVNLSRVDYLFDNNLHDLPDDQRPDCHKNGTSYTSVYGRMHWDRPAQTITTGFGTPGQGRYIHPLRRRLITPREAARIQGFPDWYNFVPDEVSVKRKHLAKWIGDAVHPVLGYTVGLAAIAALSESFGLVSKAA